MLSTRNERRLAHATHESLVWDEVDSAPAAQAVRDVVAAVRSREPD